MPRTYNDPAGGNQSDIGNVQFNEFFWQKKAMIEAKKEQFFGQLADVVSMPKNMGKTIKKYHYLPLLDDANINDQGIDAAGLSVNQSVTIVVTREDGSVPHIPGERDTRTALSYFFVGEGATAALAEDAARVSFMEWVISAVAAGGLGFALTTSDADFATTVTTGGLSAFDKGFRFAQPDGTTITAAAGALEAQSVPESGNLYGSSKDVGTITSKLPALSETGGRVNRVGFKRIELEGSIEKFGFFDEYTQESLDFDTDAELEQHITREMVMGANEITEDALQIDLLNAAGIVRFGGEAIATNELNGEAGTESLVSYTTLMKLSITLDNNRTPKSTKIITGTRMVDTRTVNAARFMYIGSELIPMIKSMKDNFDNQAFISVEKYAAGGPLAEGEIGMVDQFKIIVVPEMMHWEGDGADVTTNNGFRETGGKYDVFPMLVVGSQSFTTIGFQTDGKTVKFKIKNAKPGSIESYANDPYGETGFSSIKWYYGTMILRPERIALVKVVAEW